MTIPEMIRDVQEALGIDADGVAGPVTWRAVHQRICGVPKAVPAPLNHSGLDKRSQKNIATIHPQIGFLAERLVKAAASSGIDCRVICGLRTFAEQEAIYAIGRTKPGKIATNARGGQSWHNYGMAFDVGLFHGDDYLEDSPLYKEVGKIGRGLGLEWGGDWKWKDEPHFQIRPSWAAGMESPRILAEFKRRMDSGRDLWA